MVDEWTKEIDTRLHAVEKELAAHTAVCVERYRNLEEKIDALQETCDELSAMVSRFKTAKARLEGNWQSISVVGLIVVNIGALVAQWLFG